MNDALVVIWWVSGTALLIWDNHANWKRVKGIDFADLIFWMLAAVGGFMGPLLLFLVYALHHTKDFSNINKRDNPFGGPHE